MVNDTNTIFERLGLDNTSGDGSYAENFLEVAQTFYGLIEVLVKQKKARKLEKSINPRPLNLFTQLVSFVGSSTERISTKGLLSFDTAINLVNVEAGASREWNMKEALTKIVQTASYAQQFAVAAATDGRVVPSMRSRSTYVVQRPSPVTDEMIDFVSSSVGGKWRNIGRVPTFGGLNRRLSREDS